MSGGDFPPWPPLSDAPPWRAPPNPDPVIGVPATVYPGAIENLRRQIERLAHEIQKVRAATNALARLECENTDAAAATVEIEILKRFLSHDD